MGLQEDRLERGIAYKIEGRYEEATTEFLAILAVDPDHAEAHHQMGLVLGFVGEFEKSVTETGTRNPA